MKSQLISECRDSINASLQSVARGLVKIVGLAILLALRIAVVALYLIPGLGVCLLIMGAIEYFREGIVSRKLFAVIPLGLLWIPITYIAEAISKELDRIGGEFAFKEGEPTFILVRSSDRLFVKCFSLCILVSVLSGTALSVWWILFKW